MAAIAAAGFAGIAAYHTSRSADEAAKSHKTFIESERGRIEVARVAYEHGRLVLKIKNIGGSVAIITGVLGEVDSNWMDDPSGPLGHYQLKLANDGRASLPVLVVLPDMPVRSVVGFISYRTLGVPDCRTHFSCTIERSGGVPTIELANPIWQPDDT